MKRKSVSRRAGQAAPKKISAGAVIIANGDLPRRSIVRGILNKRVFIVCADGGADKARRLGIRPDVIIGDFDSITQGTRNYFRTIPQVHAPDQYSTDLEKAILLCIELKFASVTIIGSSGDRIDHVTGALGCLRRFAGRIDLRLVNEVCTTECINGSIRFPSRPGEKVSLIPFTRCTGITTRNLLYPLKNDSLEMGVREGISNESTGKSVEISVRSGFLFLCRFH